MVWLHVGYRTVGYVEREAYAAAVLMARMEDTSSCGTSLTLNPRFVEALMGLPIGWTGFDFAATQWSRWLRRMRCEFLRLSSPGL